jgi:hypothetical protein
MNRFIVFIANPYETGNSLSGNGSFFKTLSKAKQCAIARPTSFFAEIFDTVSGKMVAEYNSIENDYKGVVNPTHTRSSPFDSEISFQTIE